MRHFTLLICQSYHYVISLNYENITKMTREVKFVENKVFTYVLHRDGKPTTTIRLLTPEKVASLNEDFRKRKEKLAWRKKNIGLKDLPKQLNV